MTIYWDIWCLWSFKIQKARLDPVYPCSEIQSAENQADIDFLIQTELEEFQIKQPSACPGKPKPNSAEWNTPNSQTDTAL